MPKNSEILFPYRQVIALLRGAHTRYILPTTHSNFKVFLKIQKLEVIDDIPKEPLNGYSNRTHVKIVLFHHRC